MNRVTCPPTRIVSLPTMDGISIFSLWYEPLIGRHRTWRRLNGCFLKSCPPQWAGIKTGGSPTLLSCQGLRWQANPPSLRKRACHPCDPPHMPEIELLSHQARTHHFWRVGLRKLILWSEERTLSPSDQVKQVSLPWFRSCLPVKTFHP